MQAIRKIVSRDIFKNFEIPKEFGDRFEMILLSIENDRGYFEIEDKNGVLHKVPNWTEDEFKELGLRSFFEEYDNEKENELFLASIYDTVIEDSDKEDEIWSKYLWILK